MHYLLFPALGRRSEGLGKLYGYWSQDMVIRVGFVGTGGIAQAHFEALLQLSEVQLVAFCDVDPARAERAAQRFGGRAYTDFQTMLHETPMDALYVCVPPHAHEGAEELAAEMGIHLFVEKPVARTLERARAIESTIRRAGILSMVGYHFRYYGATERARERLQGQTPILVKGAWEGGMPGVEWWRHHALSGGQIVEQTTHIFDLARYLVGEIVQVSAYFMHQPTLMPFPGGDVSASGAVALQFANGTVGTITNTCVLEAPGETGLKVYTPSRIVAVSWARMTEWEPNRKEEFFSRDNAYYNEACAFVQAIREKNPALIKADYSEGVRTLAVTLAADESARTGKPVTVLG